jgi:DNA polymerase III subunit delta
MKFYANNFDQVIQKIASGQINSILFFGPDNGVISDLISQLTIKLSSPTRLISDDELSDYSSALNNISFFSSKEIIKFDVKSIKLDQSLKAVLTKSNHNFPIFIASELEPSNSYRKFFESENNLAAIACYADDETAVRRIISSNLSQNKMRISPDALDFLCKNLHGNRNLIKSEIDKLISYKGINTQINLNDCENIICQSLEANPDYLCINFANKNAESYLKELDLLLKNEISVVWIIRALSRFYMNLAHAKLMEKDGVAIDQALNSLKPKIFYKNVQDFKKIVRSISLIEIQNVLEALTQAEVNFKTFSSNNVLDEIFYKNFIAINYYNKPS